MPGNKMYKISRFVDRLNAYWYFGNIAKFRYHLALSDKYLVESKTLFEYGQYLLASDALQRSDKAVVSAVPYINRAELEGKNMVNLTKIFVDAMDGHIKILEKLIGETPTEFQWTPEKEKNTDLQIGQMLHTSIQHRKDAMYKVLDNKD